MITSHADHCFHNRKTRTLNETVFPVMFLNEVRKIMICGHISMWQDDVQEAQWDTTLLFPCLLIECGDWWRICSESEQVAADRHPGVQLSTYYCGTGSHSACSFHRPSGQGPQTEGTATLLICIYLISFINSSPFVRMLCLMT